MQETLETGRLRLRPLAAFDLDLLVELDSDPEVMRFLNGGVPTPRAALVGDILPRMLAVAERCPGFGYWAIEARETGAFLGWVSLRPAEGGPDGEAELGYRLRRAAWGRGLATEAARALVRHAFTALGVRRIVATTFGKNHASRRVLEKVGLRLLRTYRIDAAELLSADTYCVTPGQLLDGNDVDYALDREEWRD